VTTPQHLQSCPAPEVLVLFVEGKLIGTARNEVSRHVKACSECVFVVGETSRFLQEETDTSLEDERPAGRYRGSWRLAAAAALVLIAAGGLWQWSLARDDVRRLAAVAKKVPVRALEGRLGGFQHAPFEGVRSERERRGGELQVVASAVATDPDADLHARGIAELLRGNSRAAVDLLSRAARNRPERAGYWSDLAAARIAGARASRDRRELENAIADASRALSLDPDSAAALFNRGIALEHLSRRGEAVADFRRAAEQDPRSGWAAEASVRISELSR